MSQYKWANANVTNGSATVTLVGVDATAEISAGDECIVVGNGIPYVVNATPTLSGSDTLVTLSTTYAGTTASGVSVTFQRDYTTDGIPILGHGDVEPGSVLGRLASVIQSIISSILDGTKAFTNPAAVRTQLVAGGMHKTNARPADADMNAGDKWADIDYGTGVCAVYCIVDPTNASLDSLEAFVATADGKWLPLDNTEPTTVDCTAGGTVTLTALQNAYGLYNLTGTPGAAFSLVVSNIKRTFHVNNNSGQIATVKTAAGTGITVANGALVALRNDGTNVVETEYNPANVNITGGNVSGITDLALADGGTGASTAAGARTNLGVEIDVDVAAYIQNNYSGSAAPTVNDDSSAGYSAGSLWFNLTASPKEAYRCLDASVGAAVWLNTTLELGELGTIATQNANNVAITGGSVSGIADLALADGGTGASTAAGARTNLDVYSTTQVNGLLYGSISGYICSNNATDSNNDIDIAAGVAFDSTNTGILVGSAMTKQLDVTWSAGTNAGGLDTGTKAANTEYYIHAILKDSDASVDYLFSTSRTAPTMPTGYTKFRNVGWCKTDGSSNIIAFIAIEDSGGGLIYEWSTPIADVDLANTLSTTARLDTLSVITGVKVKPISVFQVYDASAPVWAIFTDPDTTDVAPSTSAFNVRSSTSSVPSQLSGILTNTSGQIRARADISTVDNYRIITFGFEWSRR